MKKYRKNVRKRRDNRYEGRFIIGYHELYGKAIYKSVYAKTYQEVIRKLEYAEASVLEEVERQRRLRKGKKALGQKGVLDAPLSKKVEVRPKVQACTLEAWMMEWLVVYKKKEIKASSYTRYITMADKHIIPKLGGYLLSQITAELLQQYLFKKMEDNDGTKSLPLSASTLKGHITLLSGALEAAVKRGLLTENPCKKMRLPKKKGKKPHALGKEEYETLEQTLYRTFENKKSVAVLLALKTGIRLGELSALKWTDIDIEEGTIYIRNAVQRVKTFGKKTAKTEMVFDGTKTFSSSRAIPMNDEIREFLLKYAGQVKKNGGSLKEDFVFSNCDRSFIDPRVYQYYFSKLLKQTGIKQTNFHALRHTFATVAASKNMQISVLSRILGHSDISTTLRLYVHPLVEQDRIEMCKISKSYWSQSA